MVVLELGLLLVFSFDISNKLNKLSMRWQEDLKKKLNNWKDLNWFEKIWTNLERYGKVWKDFLKELKTVGKSWLAVMDLNLFQSCFSQFRDFKGDFNLIDSFWGIQWSPCTYAQGSMVFHNHMLVLSHLNQD